MELRHLRYFLAVAEELHITRAAKRLGIEQPPLSLQIQAFERELGARLFWRRARGVELTVAGQALLGRARNILDAVEEAANAVRMTADGAIGELRIGYTGPAGIHPRVTGAIRSLLQEAPNVTLTLKEGDSQFLLKEAERGQLDAAFVRNPKAVPEGYELIGLLTEQLFVAHHSQHRFARRRRGSPLRLIDLADEAMILHARNEPAGSHAEFLTACHKAGFSPKIVQQSPRLLSALGLVSAGLGIAIVPESLAQLRMDGVQYVRLAEQEGLGMPLYLLHRAEVMGALGILLRVLKANEDTG